MCEACQVGKTCKLPFSSLVFRSSRVLERIYCDVWGPAPVVSVQGFRFYVVFIDNYSRFCWFYPIKSKSYVFSVFKVFQLQVENQYNNKIAIFQSGGGGEFINKSLTDHFVASGIKHIVFCPHTPEQNRIAGSRHRHITELGLSMLYQSHMPYTLWVEAFYTASFLNNLLPSSVNDKMVSMFELLNKTKPIYTALRVFGCACYPYLWPYAKNKFDPKSLLCVFVGYNEKYKGYICYHPPTGRVYINRHVLFDESRLPYTDVYRHLLPTPTTPLSSAWRLLYSMLEQANTEAVSQQPQENIGRTVLVPVSSPQTTQEPIISSPSQSTPGSSESMSTESSTSDESDQNDQGDEAPVVVPPPANSHKMTTRGKAGVMKPNPRYALVTVKGLPQLPRTVTEDLNHPGWNGSMGEEIDTCHETNTWSLVPLPSGDKQISSGWVHKVKLNADGTLQKLRSRLVARGNEQTEGVNFLETYSPVARTTTVRIVLHFAVVNRWDIRQLDVKNDFLHGDLNETVYMKQPPRYEDKEHPDYVCLLHKAIYGLKQAPRAWFDKFSSYLPEFGFTCNVKDESLFVYQKEKGKGCDLLTTLR